MTANEFRNLALSFTGAAEGAHMGHADFRANGRIFATLGYPSDASGMVKLPLEEQKQLIEAHPHILSPAKGAWGLQGSTIVQLKAAKTDVIFHALDLAWQHSASPTSKSGKKPSKKSAQKAGRKSPATK